MRVIDYALLPARAKILLHRGGRLVRRNGGRGPGGYDRDATSRSRPRDRGTLVYTRPGEPRVYIIVQDEQYVEETGEPRARERERERE